MRVIGVLLFILTLGVCALTGCSNGQAQQSAEAAQGRGGGAAAGGGGGGRGRGEGPVPVATAPAVEQAMPVSVDAVGAAESISTVQIRSQVTGRITQVLFSEGQEVEAGQPLFVIDPQPFQVALEQAEAVLARDTAQANNAAAQVQRYENLFERGLIPRDQYETQVATANALKATTEADKAAVDAARLNLQYSKINAPAAGRTGALLAHKGDLVQANSTSALVVINQIAPIYVTFSVPGKLLDEIRRYQARGPLRVDARSTGDESNTATGRVTFIDNAVDEQTGTIKLKATFPNTGHALWPGQFVQVSLNLTTNPRAIVVPSTAVQAGQEGPFVFTVTGDSRAEVRPVVVDRVAGNLSVLSSGLKAGEIVVTDGQLRLTPGARIVTRGAGQQGTAGAAQ